MIERAAPFQKLTLDDLNELATALGSPRRHFWTSDSWNQLVDHVNEHAEPDAPRIDRVRRGSILSSSQWNALVDRANANRKDAQ